MTWDNIKYLFQIPLGWFKAVHNRVFKAYGTNFITVREDEDGATQIAVDDDSFAQAVRKIAGDGTVKSVDGVLPDANGNVQLNAVLTVDGEEPDEDGNVQLDAVRSVNGETPDSAGAVEIDVGVLTVNNTSPDANGNVNVNVDTSDCIKTSDWMSTTSNYNVCPYVYANTAFTGNVLSAITNLYSWVGALTYQTLEACLIALGFVQDSDLGDLAYLDSITVDGHSSDSNGEVSFGLAANKWVKTDASGHLATTNDTPIAIDTSQYTPLTPPNPLKVITNVSWNGTTLKYSSENWTFVNGVLVARTTNSDTTIDTPVAY